MNRILLACVLAALPGAARAEWHKASSDHFVVYANDSAKDIQLFAEMLEKFHSAMEFVTTQRADKPSPSNRVTIYAVGDEKKVRELYGDKRANVAGFYQSRAGGSVAFVPDIRVGSKELDFSVIVLLHEYAHHFLMSSSRSAMPTWMNEGAAEFFASAKFDRDGTVWVGAPARHRAGELFYAANVSLEELFDPELYARRKSRGFDEFYGRSWLLYHYLTFASERGGQMAKYARSVAGGTSSSEAARDAFGDLKVLDRELSSYIRQRRMTAFSLKPALLSPGKVTVTKISAGAAEIMPIILQSKRGVTREEAEKLVVEARAIAAKHPADAMVQAALAEAEFDSGNSKAAIEAADRAIAADPQIANAYVQKGYAMFDLASEADDVDKAFDEALKPFTELNKFENDHPLPLIYFYRSFSERGEEPTELARHAIERAAELAPFDKGLWMTVGMMQAWEGQIALAIASLSTMANDPHGGEGARVAQFYIDALRGAPEGESFNLGSVVVPPKVDIPDLPVPE